MRIGIDASRANLLERTGTEWYAFYIISEWIRSNAFAPHSVVLYAREPLRNDFPALPKNWEVRVLSWPFILWTQLRLAIEMILRPVDILFVPAHTIPFIHPKKTFTTIHDIGFETDQHVYSTKSVAHVKSGLLRALANVAVRIITFGTYGANELDYQRFSVRLAIKKAKTIFTVSEYSKKEIERVFKSHPPILVAYNGIQHHDFYFPFDQSLIAHLKERLGLSRYILSLGRIEKKKNSLELLKAFHRYMTTNHDLEMKLVFAGGKGIGYEDVQAYVEKHELNDRIVFLGWVDQKTIPPLIAGTDLFAQFSEYEGFGVPVVQAMALGVPVLANDLPVFREIAKDTIFYCNAHDIEGSAKTMAHILLQSPEDKKKGSQRAITLSQKYEWKKSAQRIAEAILA